MKRQQEHTLFRPDPKVLLPGGRSGRSPGTDPDDEPQITIKDRIAEACRSAGRRKLLTFCVALLCIALTAFAAIYAPRQYEVEARILVSRTSALSGQSGQFPATADEKKDVAREFEEQILSRDNIISIIKQTELVERW